LNILVEDMRRSLTLFGRTLAATFARYCVANEATTAVEFAFVVPFIVAILLAAFQIAVIYTAQSYLEAVAEDVERIVLTNNAYNLTQAQFKTQVCANVQALFNCSNVIVNLQPIPTCTAPSTTAQCMANLMPQFDSSGNLKNPTNFNPGSPQTKMILTLMYQWPVISGPLGMTFSNLGNGYYLLASTQVFQIELCTVSSGCVPNG
jgi:Flp pilus assembly protein TadG